MNNYLNRLNQTIEDLSGNYANPPLVPYRTAGDRLIRNIRKIVRIKI